MEKYLEDKNVSITKLSEVVSDLLSACLLADSTHKDLLGLAVSAPESMVVIPDTPHPIPQILH